jgi:hypothetical protein
MEVKRAKAITDWELNARGEKTRRYLHATG